MTTGFDLDEIERLLAAAAAGPWQAIGTDPAEGGDWFWVKGPPNSVMRGFTKEIGAINGSQSNPEASANAALIVTLRNSAPAMIAEIRELRAENARLREMTATNKQAWDNALEFGIIPERHRNTVQIMSDGCRAALGEPQ